MAPTCCSRRCSRSGAQRRRRRRRRRVSQAVSTTEVMPHRRRGPRARGGQPLTQRTRYSRLPPITRLPTTPATRNTSAPAPSSRSTRRADGRAQEAIRATLPGAHPASIQILFTASGPCWIWPARRTASKRAVRGLLRHARARGLARVGGLPAQRRLSCAGCPWPASMIDLMPIMWLPQGTGGHLPSTSMTRNGSWV